MDIEKDVKCLWRLLELCMNICACDDDIGAGQLTVNDPKFYMIVYKARQALSNLEERVKTE